jgi:uncharacterized protein YqgV (UPF0045/DUF77 family)
MTQNTISAQVSLYPLRQAHLTPGIAKLADALRASGLEVRPGSMSTVVIGDAERVFDCLKASFQAAAAVGDVVMVVSFSNCCPVTASEQNSPAAAKPTSR